VVSDVAVDPGVRVGEAETLLHLVPPVVGPDDNLADVVSTLAADPVPRSAFVCGPDGRLLGVVSQDDLDRDMLALLAPGAAGLVAESLGPRSLTRIAHGTAETARGLMREAAAVGVGDTVGAALRSMRDHNLESAAVLDDEGRLLGYVALFELLAAMLVDASST
jgi:CBS domain-containing protein